MAEYDPSFLQRAEQMPDTLPEGTTVTNPEQWQLLRQVFADAGLTAGTADYIVGDNMFAFTPADPGQGGLTGNTEEILFGSFEKWGVSPIYAHSIAETVARVDATLAVGVPV